MSPKLHCASGLHRRWLLQRQCWTALHMCTVPGNEGAVIADVREPSAAEAVLARGGGPWREYGLMLHHPGLWPAGAICPTRALLLPPPDAASTAGGAAEAAEDAAAGAATGTPAAGTPVVSAAATDAPKEAAADTRVPLRLWLWLHPAAYAEALSMLQAACGQPAAGSEQRASDSMQAALDSPGHLQLDDAAEQQQSSVQAPPPAPPPHQQQQQADTAAETVRPPAAPLDADSSQRCYRVAIAPLGAHLRRLELRGPASTTALARMLPDFTALTSPPAPDGAARSWRRSWGKSLSLLEL